MNSSGIKRSLAVAATSALAIAGLPLLATSASAVPNSSTTNVGADAVEFYSANAGAVSAKNDGTNTTVSLVVGGGSNVTSVQYQVRYNNTGDFVNIGAPVGRNADGGWVFYLADGSVWSQTDDWPLGLPPERGDKVVVSRGLLGSFRLRLNKQPEIKVKRIG